jgi:sugar O-acyltransferase (sialic acid O-acetyltransferase NeuD family)
MPVIVGAGGHAKVVMDALIASGTARDTISVRDGDPAREGTEVAGFRIACPELPDGTREALHIAIGSNAARAMLHERAAQSAFVTVVHPSASVADSAMLGAGSFVGAGAVIGPEAVIGKSVIVNHGAVIDHDCAVGDFSHVAPNATLGGGVTVGARVLIGSGAVLLPGVSVGDGATVGAGAVVLGDIGEGETWAGNPATKLG